MHAKVLGKTRVTDSRMLWRNEWLAPLHLIPRLLHFGISARVAQPTRWPIPNILSLVPYCKPPYTAMIRIFGPGWGPTTAPPGEQRFACSLEKGLLTYQRGIRTRRKTRRNEATPPARWPDGEGLPCCSCGCYSGSPGHRGKQRTDGGLEHQHHIDSGGNC